mgnify:CR=1 FL=1
MFYNHFLNLTFVSLHGICSAICFAALLAANAHAQQSAAAYPVKPVRLVVPFPPGGGTDAIARAAAQGLSDGLGQSVVVDNRPGAGGTIGAELGVRAAPDGYTLTMVSASYAANAALFQLPYDAVNDITPVMLMAEAGFIVAIHPGVPAKSIKELIAHAKANSGSLNYASSGTGGITHLASELFLMAAGIRMTHIPYKGTGPSTVDLISGQVQMKLSAVPSLVQHMASGRVRGLAITTLNRSAILPEMPALAETFPGFQVSSWYGCWGPKHLPRDIVSRWNSVIAKTLATPVMRERMTAEGLDAIGGPPERLRERLKDEVPKLNKVVKAANIRTIQ